MDWTDCPIIEQVPGRMSGAPVLRDTRVRPEDLLANIEQGPDWLADAYSLPVEDVRQFLAFFAKFGDQLPLEYTSPERKAVIQRAPAV